MRRDSKCIALRNPQQKNNGWLARATHALQVLGSKGDLIYFFGGCFFFPYVVSTDDPMLVSICFAASA